MKKALLFLLFFTTVVYSQQDTIQIKERDITYIHKEYPNEPENVLDFKHGTYYYALCKSPHERLEGFSVEGKTALLQRIPNDQG